MKLFRVLAAAAVAGVLAVPPAHAADQGRGRGRGQAKKAEKADKDDKAAKADKDDKEDQAEQNELGARFDRLDRDHDGRLGRNEWDGSPAAFNARDLNHDGVVTRAEYIEFARRPATAKPDLSTKSAAFRAGYDRGIAEGRQAGKEDKTINGGKWDLEGQRELEQADSGYDARFGPRDQYQAGYREGFRRGYGEGFGPRR